MVKSIKSTKFFVIILSGLIIEATPLEISSLSLPSYAEEGQNVTFHCDYSVDSSKLAELDIKWYLGSSPSPFLVFLPHLQTEPQVVDLRFRQKIVFSEGVVGSVFMMVNITTDMSGVYTCKVSTNTEERRSWKRITVYSKWKLTRNSIHNPAFQHFQSHLTISFCP